MNAKKARAMRQRAKTLTPQLPPEGYRPGKTVRLSECTKGAYRALKSGRYRLSVDE